MTYQDIDGLHLRQGLKVSISMVQVERDAVHISEVGPGRQQQLGITPVQHLLVVLNTPLVVALDEGDLESGL